MTRMRPWPFLVRCIRWYRCRAIARARKSLEGFSLGFLWQDVARLLPQGWYPRIHAGGAELSDPELASLARSLADWLPTSPIGQGGGHLHAAVEDFLGLVSRQLVIYGRAVFVFANEPDPQAAPTNSNESVSDESLLPMRGMSALTEGTFVRLGGMTVLLPDEAEAELEVLPRGEAITFEMPREYRRRVRRAVRGLRASDRTRPGLDVPVGGDLTASGYNFGEHQKNHRLLLARATSGIGYTARDQVVADGTPVYSLYRLIRWRLFRTVLRDQIVADMNRAINRARPGGVERIEVSLHDVLRADELASLEDALRTNAVPMAEIHKRVLRG